jgi:DNA-binding MarR family transcriptional regulator
MSVISYNVQCFAGDSQDCLEGGTLWKNFICRIAKMAKIKSIFNSRFTLPILVKIARGYRPILIAKQLEITPQALHYHTDNLIDADLVVKVKGVELMWMLTQKGELILKELLRRSVSPFNNSSVPIRLENVSVAFKILNQIPDNDRLKWSNMNNGVAKCTAIKNDHTVELVKSEKGHSTMLIHLSKQHCFNQYDKLFSQAYLALHYAKQAATQFGIQIVEYGSLVKRPHIAFEKDMIATFLAASQTAEINTEGEGKAWLDASMGDGELETNDPEYVYKYLIMPENVMNMRSSLDSLVRKSSAFVSCYDPILTDNN